MKYIKTFESSNKLLELGTYVICDEETSNIELKNFLKNNIGVIKYYFDGINEDLPYMVYYKNLKNLKKSSIGIIDRFNEEIKFPDCRAMREKEIIHHSKNKEDLEPFILANKFNI